MSKKKNNQKEAPPQNNTNNEVAPVNNHPAAGSFKANIVPEQHSKKIKDKVYFAELAKLQIELV